MKYFISIINTAILVAIFFMIFGCSTIEKRVTDGFKLENAPVRVAVLPFDLDTLNGEDQEIATIFRRIFYGHFSYLGYIDIDIDKIDKTLADNMLTSTEDIYLHSYDYLGEMLGADALIYCTIRKVSNVTAGIYAETSIEAELKMVDSSTGSFIWEADSKEIDINGILSPSSLITMIQKQIDNSKKRESLIRIAERFSKKVVKTIPDPAPLTAENIHLPEIYTVKANIHNKTAYRGFILEFYLKGEKGMEASFDIGDWKTNIPMQEQSPGEYTGYYKVRNEDHLKKALIIGKLENSNGLISKKIFEKGMVGFSSVF
tara:strand:+ start:7643 stop:8590 length:948 start_codon:yes stop_codon:yes gene_type:complete